MNRENYIKNILSKKISQNYYDTFKNQVTEAIATYKKFKDNTIYLPKSMQAELKEFEKNLEIFKKMTTATLLGTKHGRINKYLQQEYERKQKKLDENSLVTAIENDFTNFLNKAKYLEAECNKWQKSVKSVYSYLNKQKQNIEKAKEYNDKVLRKLKDPNDLDYGFLHKPSGNNIAQTVQEFSLKTHYQGAADIANKEFENLLELSNSRDINEVKKYIEYNLVEKDLYTGSTNHRNISAQFNGTKMYLNSEIQNLEKSPRYFKNLEDNFKNRFTNIINNPSDTNKIRDFHNVLNRIKKIKPNQIAQDGKSTLVGTLNNIMRETLREKRKNSEDKDIPLEQRKEELNNIIKLLKKVDPKQKNVILKIQLQELKKRQRSLGFKKFQQRVSKGMQGILSRFKKVKGSETSPLGPTPKRKLPQSPSATTEKQADTLIEYRQKRKNRLSADRAILKKKIMRKPPPRRELPKRKPPGRGSP